MREKKNLWDRLGCLTSQIVPASRRVSATELLNREVSKDVTETVPEGKMGAAAVDCGDECGSTEETLCAETRQPEWSSHFHSLEKQMEAVARVRCMLSLREGKISGDWTAMSAMRGLQRAVRKEKVWSCNSHGTNSFWSMLTVVCAHVGVQRRVQRPCCSLRMTLANLKDRFGGIRREQHTNVTPSLFLFPSWRPEDRSATHNAAGLAWIVIADTVFYAAITLFASQDFRCLFTSPPCEIVLSPPSPIIQSLGPASSDALASLSPARLCRPSRFDLSV